MKLTELVTPENKPNPAVEAKKRQLEQLKKQRDQAKKQLVAFKQNDETKQNPALENRIKQIEDRIYKLKSTMIDALDVQEK